MEEGGGMRRSQNLALGKIQRIGCIGVAIAIRILIIFMGGLFSQKNKPNYVNGKLDSLRRLIWTPEMMTLSETSKHLFAQLQHWACLSTQYKKEKMNSIC